LGEFSPIGRLFSSSSFSKTTEVAQKILGYYFSGKNYVCILIKNGLGYILVDLKNSSGHPDPNQK
jgi:hypothetical protein